MWIVHLIIKLVSSFPNLASETLKRFWPKDKSIFQFWIRDPVGVQRDRDIRVQGEHLVILRESRNTPRKIKILSISQIVYLFHR